MTILEARRLVGYTRHRLAEAAGTTTTTIYDLETGRNKRPAYETVVRLIRALQEAGLKGITAEQLFPVEDESSTATDEVAS